MTGLVPFQPGLPATTGKTYDNGLVADALATDELKYVGDGIFQYIKGGNVVGQFTGHADVMLLWASAATSSNLYYPGTYDPNNSVPPECWSSDGEVPDTVAPGPSKLHAKPNTCRECPMKVEGSHPGGTGAKACSSLRYLVVTPAPVPGEPFQPTLWRLTLKGQALFMPTGQEAQHQFSLIGNRKSGGGLLSFLDASGYAGRHHQVVLRLTPDVQPGAMRKIKFQPVQVIQDPAVVAATEAVMDENMDRMKEMVALSFRPSSGNGDVQSAVGQQTHVAAAQPQATPASGNGLGAGSPLNQQPQQQVYQQPAQQQVYQQPAQQQVYQQPAQQQVYQQQPQQQVYQQPQQPQQPAQQTMAPPSGNPGAPAQTMGAPGQPMTTAPSQGHPAAHGMQPPGNQPAGQVMGHTTTFAGAGAPPPAQPQGPGTVQTDPHAVDAQLAGIIGGAVGPQG